MRSPAVVRRVVAVAVGLGLVAGGCSADAPVVDGLTPAESATTEAVARDATSVHWVGEPVSLEQVSSAAWSDPDWATATVTDPSVEVGAVLLVHREGDGTMSVNQTDTTSSVDGFNWHPWLGDHIEVEGPGREFVVTDGEVPGGTCAQWDVVQPWRVVERRGDVVEARLDEVLVARTACTEPIG